jgi:dTDP-4-dehydrorhamnose reductase
MKILVTGCNGQLGRELQNLSKNSRLHTFLFTDLPELDICKPASIKKFVSSFKPDLLINCAAYTAVDLAEKEAKAAMMLNGTAVGHLADIAAGNDIRMIHISTDYIFSGEGFRPYVETESAHPKSVYAKSKFAGEEAMIKAGVQGVILRTSWLYSEFGQNFVNTILKLASNRKELSVVYDQVGTPTYARDLAEAILKIIPAVRKIKDVQVYHYSNEGVASWYDVSKAILEIKKITTCHVLPIESKDFKQAAARPFYSVLNKEKIRKTFGIEIPYWRDSLRDCLKRIK